MNDEGSAWVYVGSSVIRVPMPNESEPMLRFVLPPIKVGQAPQFCHYIIQNWTPSAFFTYTTINARWEKGLRDRSKRPRSRGGSEKVDSTALARTASDTESLEPSEATVALSNVGDTLEESSVADVVTIDPDTAETAASSSSSSSSSSITDQATAEKAMDAAIADVWLCEACLRLWVRRRSQTGDAHVHTQNRETELWWNREYTHEKSAIFSKAFTGATKKRMHRGHG